VGGWLVLAHELEAQQAAARTVHTRGGTRVLGDKAHYRPTGTWLEHPKPVQEQVRGRGWSYQPDTEPAAASTRTQEGVND